MRSSLSLRYRLTNGHHFDDVHLQLIIEILFNIKFLQSINQSLSLSPPLSLSPTHNTNPPVYMNRNSSRFKTIPGELRWSSRTPLQLTPDHSSEPEILSVETRS
eukprot:sb/3478112/